MLRIILVKDWKILYIFYDDEDRDRGYDVWRRARECQKLGKWEEAPIAYNISKVSWAREKLRRIEEFCNKNPDACIELTPNLVVC